MITAAACVPGADRLEPLSALPRESLRPAASEVRSAFDARLRAAFEPRLGTHGLDPRRGQRPVPGDARPRLRAARRFTPRALPPSTDGRARRARWTPRPVPRMADSTATDSSAQMRPNAWTRHCPRTSMSSSPASTCRRRRGCAPRLSGGQGRAGLHPWRRGRSSRRTSSGRGLCPSGSARCTWSCREHPCRDAIPRLRWRFSRRDARLLDVSDVASEGVAELMTEIAIRFQSVDPVSLVGHGGAHAVALRAGAGEFARRRRGHHGRASNRRDKPWRLPAESSRGRLQGHRLCIRLHVLRRGIDETIAANPYLIGSLRRQVGTRKRPRSSVTTILIKPVGKSLVRRLPTVADHLNRQHLLPLDRLHDFVGVEFGLVWWRIRRSGRW